LYLFFSRHCKEQLAALVKLVARRQMVRAHASELLAALSPGQLDVVVAKGDGSEKHLGPSAKEYLFLQVPARACL
jgi:hypothetical protein